MTLTVLKPFNTNLRRFRPGDVVEAATNLAPFTEADLIEAGKLDLVTAAALSPSVRPATPSIPAVATATSATEN